MRLVLALLAALAFAGCTRGTTPHEHRHDHLHRHADGTEHAHPHAHAHVHEPADDVHATLDGHEAPVAAHEHGHDAPARLGAAE